MSDEPKIKPENPIVIYFKTLKTLITKPGDFFRTLKRPTGFVRPLVFGIITNWIGSALQYLWLTGFGKFFGTRFSDIFKALDNAPNIDSNDPMGSTLAMRERIIDWAFGMSSVLIDPFKTCAQILFLSFFVWVGARIFAKITADGEQRLGYESAVSIVGYSLAASIFKGIPVLGGMIAAFFAVIISIAGARETYGVGSGRALVIALFPTLLFWGLILAGVITFFSALMMMLIH